MAYNTKLYKSQDTVWEEVRVASDWSLISNKPATYTPTAHPHTFASITSKPTTISGYSITDAYTKTEIDTKLATKLNKSDISYNSSTKTLTITV